MKVNLRVVLVLALSLILCAAVTAAQEMSKDQWQQEMQRYTTMRDDMSAKVKELASQIADMKSQSSGLDDQITKCMEELYALVGATPEQADAYRMEIEDAENSADALARLSDADLMERSEDVDALAAKVKGLWDNKLSLVPEFYDRLTALNQKIKSLQNTLSGQVKVYTVGTWRHDRDCLWNIAKKKDIYNNAWWWPKIWQGNRDQIRDPDIIHPGQKLKIPQAGPLNSDEKSAANRYYRNKAARAE
jgi:archaellum component FlaC